MSQSDITIMDGDDELTLQEWVDGVSEALEKMAYIMEAHSGALAHIMATTMSNDDDTVH